MSTVTLGELLRQHFIGLRETGITQPDLNLTENLWYELNPAAQTISLQELAQLCQEEWGERAQKLDVPSL